MPSFKDKNSAREYVWDTLTEQKAAAFPFPVRGRIPNFVGAKLAAEKLLAHSVWNNVRCVKCNPDSPQRYLREMLLHRGIRYVFPTPRLRGGFYLFDPTRIPKEHYRAAATLSTCMQWGKPVNLEDLPEIDLIVTGTVAVTKDGRRCGKGHGYGDLEYGLFRELGHEPQAVVTTAHELQIVEDFPVDDHDLPVSIIATPERIIEVDKTSKCPEGISWEKLSDQDLEEMPILRTLKDITTGADR